MIAKLKFQERIVSLGIKDAQVFGELIYLLKRNGTPIPIIDLLIGSIAISKNLTLISTDRNHFGVIKNVKEDFKVKYW